MMKRQFSAALVVTVTQAIADEIRDLDPSANVEIVSPAVQLLHVQPVPKHVTTKPYYLAVGSIEPRKNLKALATAFELSRLQNDFDLVLVGRQAWGELPRGVIATGVISDGELRYMMERAVGLVCPSLYEGFGLPVAEAVSLGTAVACSDIPALREVAPEANIFFDPTDVHAMSEALIKLAHLEPGSAEKSARTPFTLSRMREQLIQAYAAVGLTVG
jgi:glycosyltransferase involved in cell wall biosynthesis